MLARITFRRFLDDQSGATALEFSILAVPFFLFVFAVIETSLVYYATANLENGVHEASRQIRTGRLQEYGGGLAEFKTIICDNVSAVIDCGDNLHIDVRTFDSFGGVDMPDPLAGGGGGDFGDGMEFDPGAAGDVILVRAFYVWDLVTPIVGEALANMDGGKRLLSASAAFRNEPFEDVLPSGGGEGGF